MKLFKGVKSVDDRGSVSFVNDFNFFDVEIQRFYQVENYRAGFIRAWHGHEKEVKYVYVVKGAAIIQGISFAGVECAQQPLRYVLSADNPGVLCIPSGYYNGFKTLTDDTILMFFSTSTLKESKEDDFRLPVSAVRTDGWDVVPR